MNDLEEREEVKKERQVLPVKIKKKKMYPTLIITIRYGSSKHPYYEYQREMVRNRLSFWLGNR